MTEAEWLVSDDPDAMYVAVERGASGRKLQLFGVACCRRVWDLMTDPEHRAAADAAERFADGLIDEEALNAAFAPVGETVRESPTEWTVHRWMASAVQHVWGSDAAGWAASFAARGRAASCGPEGSLEWDAADRAEESGAANTCGGRLPGRIGDDQEHPSPGVAAPTSMKPRTRSRVRTHRPSQTPRALPPPNAARASDRGDGRHGSGPAWLSTLPAVFAASPLPYNGARHGTSPPFPDAAHAAVHR